MSVLIEIGNALEKGKKKLVVQYVQQALEEGFSAQDILTEGLLPGMIGWVSNSAPMRSLSPRCWWPPGR